MKCDFVVGQKVVCVDDDWSGLTLDWSGNIVPECEKKFRVPMLYEVLTIDVILDRFDNITLKFREIPHGFWIYTHFRPLVQRKTDISVFRAMLTPAGKVPVDA